MSGSIAVLVSLLALAICYIFYLRITNAREMRGLRILLEHHADDLNRMSQSQTAIIRSAVQSEYELKLKKWQSEYEKTIRADAVKKSEAVTIGKVSEHIAPHLPNFKWDPRDARFIGSPIDYIVFDGLSTGVVKNVIFLEVKTGASSLTTREREIRNSINKSNITWEIMKIAKEQA